jgi:hypothetical protein
MPIVFIAGSIAIKKLHRDFCLRIENAVKSGLEIVVGDADGADTSIQNELFKLSAKLVTVYCTGDQPRNNVGDWPVHYVSSNAEPGSRAYFTAKDVEMARVADFGLMVWDTKSPGTLSNVIELLRRNRKSVVYINRDKIFETISETKSLHHLISIMSPIARQKAEEKIGLSTKIHSISHQQFDLLM